MTDAEAADELRRLFNVPWIQASRGRRKAAIERAIELLEGTQVNYRDIVPPWAIDEGNPPHDPRR